MDQDYNERLTAFQADLALRTSSYMVRRYTTFGRPFAIDDTMYFQLKSDIADHFAIHPSEIIMVGSGKLGFSIKPTKRFAAFGDQSDIDMAIISPTLFDQIWLEVLQYSESGDYWFYEKKRSFQDYLFRGWIRPDKLPPSNVFNTSKEWWEFFNSLTRNYGTFKINGGLYKSWYHFEIYQSIAVELCMQNLEFGDNE